MLLRRIDRSPTAAHADPCVRTLVADDPREQWISAALSADGRIAVTASARGAVTVWDVADGERRRLPVRCDGPAPRIVVAVDARGASIATLHGGTTEVWDARTGERRGVASDLPRDPLRAVFLSTHMLAATYGDFTIRIVTIDPGSQRDLSGHTDLVWALAVERDGTRLASASDDGTIRLWDVGQGTMLRVWTAHDQRRSPGITALAFEPDRDRLVSASSGGELRVWELASGRIVRSLNGAPFGVGSLAVSGAGHIVAGQGDATVSVWDSTRDEPWRTFGRHTADVVAVAASADGERIVSVALDGTLRVWDATVASDRYDVPGLGAWIYTLALHPDGEHVVSASVRGVASYWSLDDGALVSSVPTLINIRSLVFCGEGETAILANGRTCVHVRDLRHDRVLVELEGHGDDVSSVSVGPDGTIASASADGTVRLWDLGARACVRVLAGHDGAVLSVCHVGDHIVSGGQDGTVRVWRSSAGGDVLALRGHDGPVQCVRAVPGGARVVSAGDDGAIRVWDLATGLCSLVLSGHRDMIRGVDVHPDGRRLVSASYDRTLRVWDLETGTCLATWISDAWLTACRVAPTGRIVVADAAGRVAFLELDESSEA
jgi:WD40 repeat protein